MDPRSLVGLTLGEASLLLSQDPARRRWRIASWCGEPCAFTDTAEPNPTRVNLDVEMPNGPTGYRGRVVRAFLG